MPKYLVGFKVPLDFNIEVEAENEDYAIDKATALFWYNALEYVDICQSDAEVEEIDDPEAGEWPI